VAKRRLKLHVRIPPYRPKRNSWRRKLHQAIIAAQTQRRVKYRPDDVLELDIRLYMQTRDLKSHDVDNRLKDLMDALQGRAGGPKAQRTLAAVIPNDRQIFRIVMEKAPPPWQSRGLGHLIVRELKRPKWAGAI
jgi:hypothetical protein